MSATTEDVTMETEALLDEEAIDIYSIGPIGSSTSADCQEVSQMRVLQRLANVGIDYKTTGMDGNIQKTFQFFSLNEDTAEAADIKRRCRDAGMVLQSDRLARGGDELRRFGEEAMAQILQARARALEHVSSRPPMPISCKTFQDFQEFPEKFQAAVYDHFKPCRAFMNTSELRYSSIGQCAGAEAAKRFFATLFDFETAQKAPLSETLSAELGASEQLHNSTWVIALSRPPRDFADWLHDQLTSFRLSRVCLTMHLMIFFDPIRCGWQQMSRLCDSMMQNRKFDSFRLQDTMLSPNLLCFVNTGRSANKLMKRCKILTMSTSFFNAKLDDSYLDWRKSELPRISAPHRLLFDFPGELSLKAMMVIQAIATSMHGEASEYAYRSMGSTAGNKRLAAHIMFSGEDEVPDEVQCVTAVKGALSTAGMGNGRILVGWERLLRLEEDVFMLEFDDFEWSCCDLLREAIHSIIVVSRRKTLVTIKSSIMLEDFRQLLQKHNNQSERKLRKLMDHEAVRLWEELREREGDAVKILPQHSHTLPVIGVSLQGVPKKDAPTYLSRLADAGQAMLLENGFEMQNGSVQVVRQKPTKGQIGSLRFPSLECARAFFFNFQEHPWESDDGVHSIIVRLHNASIDADMKRCKAALAMAQSGGVLTPQKLASMCQGKSMESSDQDNAILASGAVAQLPTPARASKNNVR